MSERPIIFSGPMVRAILEGRKTQTRRVVKQAHDNVARNSAWGVFPAKESGYIAWFGIPDPENGAQFTKKAYDHGFPSPYGVPGDTLWVREKWAEWGSVPGCPCYFAENDLAGVRWRPSIHMPRKYSRITLKVTGVRVERVQDISEADAKAEGISVLPLQDESDPSAWYQSEPGVHQGRSARASYAMLWDSINAKRGYSWESNPWVWVVEFERQAGGAQ